ncbi:MAG TPA: hypothetical protein VMW61_00540 [Dehalococcoidales bacterium]|nr:hypothetical protein [Dehalococcoidales bacterium]
MLSNSNFNFRASLGGYLGEVNACLADLQEHNVMARIWQKDHTVWKPEPTEITDRLGWLSVTELMRQQIASLISFAEEIKSAGFDHVVLLGMGGSSLGPEVMRQVLGSAPGYPQFIMLDSTVPAWVQQVTEAIDPARSLFLVSSKSGTTIETVSLYQYFRHLVGQALGKAKSGQNFVAITDPGTPLAELAEREFCRAFLNSADVGGRFSVLSYFGLVPAVLMGIDLAKLLDRVDFMRQRCAANISAPESDAAQLGAIVATLTLKGRDKLTIISSPAIAGFGLWVEQMIAESTGKEGKGVIPIAGEPLVEPEHYGDDRLFICLRLAGDDNSAIDNTMTKIEAAGQPVVTLEMQDGYDLGAEFFRWEFATAIAGAILGIHPFNQPGVQQAKNFTRHALAEYQTSRRLPQVKAALSIEELLAQIRPGDYLAIMAYLLQTPEADKVLDELRRKIMRQYHIPVAMGYGPRYLHSSGQLHKDGPDRGLFLQFTADHAKDLSIPGEPYTFAVLADAQAIGDFETLQSLGRRIIRIHLGRGGADSIKK